MKVILRDRHLTGGQMAVQFGVHRNTIHRIRSGQEWKWMQQSDTGSVGR